MELVAHLDNHTYLKVSDICAYVTLTYQVSYSLDGMTSWLKNNGFSYKKPAATPAKADPVKQEAFIQYYERLMNEVGPNEPVLFGDGVHPTMATKVSYGWIRRGVRKPIATTASRTRLNILGALNLENMKIITTKHETIDHKAMEVHLRRIRQAYPKALKIHAILDRGPYNISQKTKEVAIELGIVLHYLPPYSPNLNSIERCWKIMNEHVRNNKFFASAKEFRESIDHFLNETWNNIVFAMRDRVNNNFQRLQSTSSS